jgi:glycosyltransferase involved in cell wall biosynthesis
MLPSTPLISLIVPLREEPPEIARRLLALAGRFEIVVADGGCPPETRRILAESGVRRIENTGASRGARLHEAARAASGEILFFLHGDSTPPNDAASAIASAVAAGAPAGCFCLGYDEPQAAYRWIAAWANVRTRLARLPFGDQGIFCTREAYSRSGGFRDLPVCDDLDFARRLRRLPGFRVLPQACRTSPHRYRGRAAAQVLLNWKVAAGYFLGVSPSTLERWYRG